MLLSLFLQAGLISANIFFANKDFPEQLADGATNATTASTAAPGTVKTLWFNQVLDHDNGYPTTFKQKYHVNTEFYKSGGPAFLYVGGEGALTNRSISRGIIYEMAKEHNGILFGLEHRFYGESQPFQEWSIDNLKHLSTLNGVKDAGRFIKSVLNPLTNKTLENTRWITVGGSYPGSLSAWIRSEYPDLVYASLASSAPVLAKEDFYEYDQVVGKALGPQCYKDIDEVRKYIDRLYESCDEFEELKEKFGCSDVEDDVLFLSAVSDMLAGIIQYNSPTAEPNVDSICSGFSKQLDIEAKVDYFIDQMKLSLEANGQTCSDVAGLETLTNIKANGDDATRQWVYQCCTEYGYWQTAPRKGLSTRSKHLTVQWANKFYCSKDIYGKKVGPPNNKFINQRFKALNNKTPRTIWVNGDADPWMALSVTNTTQSTPDRPIYVIKKGSHATDLGADRPTDSESLTQTRKSIRADIARWLKQ